MTVPTLHSPLTLKASACALLCICHQPCAARCCACLRLARALICLWRAALAL